MLQQSSEYRSNDPVVNAVHSHAECGNNNRILLRPTTRKSNARLGEPQFGQILHCTEQNFSQGWEGRMGGFGNDWYITKKEFHSSRLLLYWNAHASFVMRI